MGADNWSADSSNLKDLSQLLKTKKNIPVFESTRLSLQQLVTEGERLEQEQEHVNRMKLSVEYLKNTGKASRSLLGLSG